MTQKEDWSKQRRHKFAESVYALGGDLVLAAQVLGIPLNKLKQYAKMRGWTLGIRFTPRGSPRSGVKHPVLSSKKYRDLALFLNQEIGISKYTIGQCLGASEPTINKLAREDRWKLAARREGQLKAKALSDSDRNSITRKYESGLSMATIASSFGVSRAIVRGILNKAEVRRRVQKIELPEQTKQQIVRDYLAGTSAATLARNLGHDGCVINQVLKEHGVERRNKIEANKNKHREHWERVRLSGVPISFTRNCRSLTALLYKQFKYLINPSGLKRGTGPGLFHLDHMYSLHAARWNTSKLRNPVNIWEVCHPANLRVIPSGKNMNKGRKRACTAKQLRARIIEWNNRYLDPYYQLDSPFLTYVGELYGEYENFYGEDWGPAKGRYYKEGNRVQR